MKKFPRLNELEQTRRTTVQEAWGDRTFTYYMVSVGTDREAFVKHLESLVGPYSYPRYFVSPHRDDEIIEEEFLSTGD